MMRDSIRLGLITPNLPHPQTSGVAIRTANVARALASVGELHIVGLAQKRDIASLSRQVHAAASWMRDFASVDLRPWEHWPAFDANWYRRVAGWRPFASTPLLHSTFPAAQLALAVEHLADEVDLVWAGRLFVAEHLRRWRRKMVVDIDDLESVKLQRTIEASVHGKPSLGMRREVRLLARAERQAAGTYRAAVVCSPADAALLGGESDSLWCVPNGVADEHFDRPPAPYDSNRLVFVGALNYAPNTDGIVQFCQQVLPAVLLRRPDTVLDIVGRAPPERVRALHDAAHVFVHADVPDVVPFVQRAALSVVPLLVGGGTRLKILESLALGTPVVSTAVGAEGIDLRSGHDALIVDGLSAMAEAIEQVLGGAELRTQLAGAGRQRARAGYGWAGIRDRLSRRVALEIEHVRRERAEGSPTGRG